MRTPNKLSHPLFRHALKFFLSSFHVGFFGAIFRIHVRAAVMLGAKLSNLLRKFAPSALGLAGLCIASFPFICHGSPSISMDRRTSVYIDIRAEFNASVICPDGRYYRTQFGTYINCENFDLWHSEMDRGIRLIELESKSPLL